MEKSITTYKSGGITAKFDFSTCDALQNILQSPFYLEDLASEIRLFHKTFWVNEHESWLGCVDNIHDYVQEFFDSCQFLEMYNHD